MKRTSTCPNLIRLFIMTSCLVFLLFLLSQSNPCNAQAVSEFMTPQMVTPNSQMAPNNQIGFPAPNAIPQTNQNFNVWRAFLPRHIPIGTVLTGKIDSTLSSVKSKPGDLFAIDLSEPLMVEGLEMVPPGARILGSVLHVSPAKFQRLGNPGQVSVALQTLVFPDGSYTPFYGFINYNPSYGNGFDAVVPGKVKHSGMSWSDYGSSVKGMVGSFGEGIAWVHNKRMLGKEFLLPQGQLLAIKTNREIDLSKMERPPASVQASSQQNMGPRTPGIAGTDPDYGYYADPNSPNQNQNPAVQTQPPADNSIFDQPINHGPIPGFNQVPGPSGDDPF